MQRNSLQHLQLPSKSSFGENKTSRGLKLMFQTFMRSKWLLAVLLLIGLLVFETHLNSPLMNKTFAPTPASSSR